jgi:hypothetical protein
MQNDKKHLDVDLGFLDEAKRPEAQVKAVSAYKVNWRNILVIGGLIVAVIGWITFNDDSSPRRSMPTPGASAPTYQSQPPAHQPPVADDSSATSNGQFSCSQSDSRQADLLMPTNQGQIEQEEQELDSRSRALNALKFQIDASNVNQDSDQFEIDSYNEMIERYNAELTSVKSAYASHQANIDYFNQQIQAHNNYLLTHCRRGR